MGQTTAIAGGSGGGSDAHLGWSLVKAHSMVPTRVHGSRFRRPALGSEEATIGKIAWKHQPDTLRGLEARVGWRAPATGGLPHRCCWSSKQAAVR